MLTEGQQVILKAAAQLANRVSWEARRTAEEAESALFSTCKDNGGHAFPRVYGSGSVDWYDSGQKCVYCGCGVDYFDASSTEVIYADGHWQNATECEAKVVSV